MTGTINPLRSDPMTREGIYDESIKGPSWCSVITRYEAWHAGRLIGTYRGVRSAVMAYARAHKKDEEGNR